MNVNINDNTATMAQETITLSSGVKIAYYDSVETHGSQAALVLLHGYCGSSAYWEKAAAELAATNRIIAPDARGHGRSSSPDDGIYAMELYADELAELLNALNVEKAILLGHSLGGYITLAFAERYSDKLIAFGLVHSTALPDSDEAKGKRDKAVEALEQHGVPDFVDALIPKLFAADRLEGLRPEVERCKEIGRATSLHGAVATAKGMKTRVDRSDIILQSKLPVLLVAGEKDGVIPIASTFAAVNANTRKVELGEAGHMSMLECPAQLVEEISSFIRSI